MLIPIAPEAIQGEQRLDIAVGADGVVWLAVGSEYPRAFRLEPEIERWRSYDPRDGMPNSDQLERVAVDGNGRIWFGFGHNNVLARCTPTQ